MTKQDDYIKYAEGAQVGRKYGIRQGITDTLTSVTGIGGLGYSIAELAKEPFDAEKYVIGLGIMALSYGVNNVLSNLNKKNQSKALKRLEDVEFEVIDTSGAQ